MPFFTEREADQFITKLRVGKVVHTNGPIMFGGARLWEIWTWDNEDKEYETRFILERDGHEPIYFDTFVVLAAHLNELFSAASCEGGASDWTRAKEKAEIQLKTITLIVASLAFLMTAGALLYLITTRDDAPLIVTTTLLGIIASGCALFFGRWIPVPRSSKNPTSADGG